MKNTNTKKQSSEKNLNKSNNKTLKEKVLKQTMYLLKVNPNGLHYSELINKVLNRIKTQDTRGTFNSIHGALQKENAKGNLKNVIKIENGIWKLAVSSVLIALFF